MAATGAVDPELARMAAKNASNVDHVVRLFTAVNADSRSLDAGIAVVSASYAGANAIYTTWQNNTSSLVQQAADHAKNALRGNTSAIRGDFELLAALAKEEAWTDATPVPPAVFGPLWPDGPPPDWPEAEEPAGAEAPELTLYFDSSEYTPAEIAEMLGIVSDVYESVSGDRLKIDYAASAEFSRMPELVPAGG